MVIRKLELNKRGQNLTLGTIIMIVLGIAVLVFLIFGFSTGWNNLWDQITGRTSGSNVEIIITSCETDCSLGEKSAYCFEEKTLRYFGENSDKSTKIEGTCYDLNNNKDLPVSGKLGCSSIKEKDCSPAANNGTGQPNNSK